MKYIILSLLLVSWHGFASQDKVYRWVDDNGVVHYSDKAVAGAKKVHIKISPSHKVPMKASNQTPAAKAEQAAAKEKTVNYQARIISPENDGTIRDNSGNIFVNVEVTPEFDGDHSLQLLIDGKPLGGKIKSTSLKATNIDRGTHTLQVQLIDKGGKIIASTSSITVHLHRAGLR
ncbi:DUF4124 domain-containing protein [Motilimonas pumila]|uniref:DUF4124 domain-containing protein n=1 Tax=Motilimonas pumila TaxID=2303987 RepID=A0A418YIW8_9GAMM|nr:DUF4124 domain-containing protein [Motilimonas pumila]RJG50562.1 DUF4124 domain-containing protein [Motilimonas pumila]